MVMGLVLISLMMAFSPLQAQSIDEYLNGGNVQLLRIDTGRIIKKQEVWAEKFAQQQFRRNAVYFGLGTACVAATGLVIYSLTKKSEKPTFEALTKDELKTYKMQLLTEHLEQKRVPRTFQEHQTWFAQNVQNALYGAIIIGLGSLFSGIVDSSWNRIKNKFNLILGSSGMDFFSERTDILFKHALRLYDSLDQFVHTTHKMSLEDEFQKKLCLGIARSLIIDHLAFVDSIEEYAAFVMQLLAQSDEISDHQRSEMQQTLILLCDLTNQMIERFELGVRAICIEGDHVKTKSLEIVMHTLSNEFDHFSQIVGILLYGDDFLKNDTPTRAS